MNSSDHSGSIKLAIEIAVYLGLIFGLLAWSFQIISPFVSLVVWATIIAVSIYSPFLKLRGFVGGSNKLAVTIITLLGLAIIILPAWLFAGSMIDSISGFNESAASGTFSVPPPDASVQEWPIIGERIYASWSLASTNLESWLSKNYEQVEALARSAVGFAASFTTGVFVSIASMLVAAYFLSNAEQLRASALRFSRRVARHRGEEFLDVSVATIRSVTLGVLGVAFIQAVLAGAGMLAVGVPGAGVWALLVMVLAIAQLPPNIVLLPVIVYVFSVETTTVAVIFAIWSIVVGFSDTLLKPMLLGRGVDTPMLVVLLGAIGGMLMSGIIGLFVGAVVFTMAYKLVQAWLDMDGTAEGVSSAD